MKLSMDNQNKIKELCELRHKCHKVTFNTNRNVYDYNLKRIESICSTLDIEEVGMLSLDNQIEELIYFFDEKEYELFELAKEEFNTSIEQYLQLIDIKYNTKTCPEGILRSNSTYVQHIKRGDIYWCERKVNGLFSSENDKYKRIPALVISSDRWNKEHDSYVVVSVTRKDSFIKENEFNVDFHLNNQEHIIRCFNPFTIRKIHMAAYISSIDTYTMQKVNKTLAKFQDLCYQSNQEEIELSSIIERIIREKSTKIRQEMIEASYSESIKLITERLNSLYPEDKIIDISDNVTSNEKEYNAVTLSPKPQKKRYNKWDNKTATKFLEDYNSYSDKKQLAILYGFKSTNSVYTTLERCRKLLSIDS